MEIGTFGDFVFEVSPRKVFSFSELSRTAGGRWAVHEPISDHVKPQYTGISQAEMSYQLILNERLGIDPAAEIERLIKIVEEGKHAPFVVGSKPIGSGDWYIESIDISYSYINHLGRVTHAIVGVTLKEYS